MRKLKLLLTTVLFLCCQLLWSQTRSVTGKVSDATGAPVSGVSVVVKGTSTGTVTGTDGNYSLNVPSSATTLVFSSLGFETREMDISGPLVNVTLNTAETSSLDEVVIVGYGTKIKKDLTGNIAQIKGSEVANTPVSNFNQALQGRAAGVFVESMNGKVGEGVKIRIRGSGSISAANSPLYVVDGIPLNEGTISGTALTDINLNDIESFDILKDASAAAIYGSRAANGVVLITTKKGKSGKTQVNVNAQYGFNKPTNNREFLNAAEYIELFTEAAINSDLIDGIDPRTPGNYAGSWLEYVEKRFTRYAGHSDWRNNETNTDWESLAYNDNSATKILDLSASGGNDKTRFFASGSFSDQEGILINNAFQRMSGRLNLEHDATQRLKIGINMGLSRTLANRVTLDNGFQTPLQMVALAPITPVRDLNGNLYNTPTTTYYNGLFEIDEVKRSSTSFRNLGNVFLNYNLVKGLVFKSELGLDIQNQNDDYYGSPLSRRSGAPSVRSRLMSCLGCAEICVMRQAR